MSDVRREILEEVNRKLVNHLANCGMDEVSAKPDSMAQAIFLVRSLIEDES